LFVIVQSLKYYETEYDSVCWIILILLLVMGSFHGFSNSVIHDMMRGDRRHHV